MKSRSKTLPATIVHAHAGAIAVKVHPRCTRLRLAFKRAPDRFTLTVPPGTSKRKVYQFVNQAESWIVKQVPVPVVSKRAPLDGVLFQGEMYQILEQHLSGRDLYEIDCVRKIIIVDAGKEVLPHRLIYLCRKEFQKLLLPLMRTHSTAMELSPKKVTIRDTRSRWGSCSSAGHISLSWRLVMAPLEVMTYVVIHELAHLKHMNHSPAFWQLVAEHCPNHKHHRQWLKVNGPKLYDF